MEREGGEKEVARKKRAESEKKKQERIKSHGLKKEQKWKEEEEVAEEVRRQFWRHRRGGQIQDIGTRGRGGGRNARMRADILTRPERTTAKFRIIVAKRWSGCNDFLQWQGHNDDASLSGGSNNRRTKMLTLIMTQGHLTLPGRVTAWRRMQGLPVMTMTMRMHPSLAAAAEAAMRTPTAIMMWWLPMLPGREVAPKRTWEEATAMTSIWWQCVSLWQCLQQQ
jgi:hypothetical protein